MTMEMTRKALLWCAVINYGILLVWFLFFVLAHDRMYLLHSRWFRLSVEQFDMLHYAGMSIFQDRHTSLKPGSLHRSPDHASHTGLNARYCDRIDLEFNFSTEAKDRQ